MTTVDLTTVLSLELGHTEALDWFVGSCLTAANVWDHPRASDGIAVLRVLERSPSRVEVAGKIYSIDDQSRHSFWLELRASRVVAWSLHYDPMESSPRRTEDAIYNHEHPEEVEWRARISGEAEIRDGVLALIAGTTRAWMQDP